MFGKLFKKKEPIRNEVVKENPAPKVRSIDKDINSVFSDIINWKNMKIEKRVKEEEVDNTEALKYIEIINSKIVKEAKDIMELYDYIDIHVRFPAYDLYKVVPVYNPRERGIYGIDFHSDYRSSITKCCLGTTIFKSCCTSLHQDSTEMVFIAKSTTERVIPKAEELKEFINTFYELKRDFYSYIDGILAS